MAAELILTLDEPLAADEEEMLIDSDDEEEICVIAATSIFMRRDLNINYGFCDVIVKKKLNSGRLTARLG